MYSRNYGNKVLSFEPSGGLINASLVMQDRETNTYWSIMNSTAIKGQLAGATLNELPVGVKVQWREWKKVHPQTTVLSVAGAEDAPPGYLNYFSSALGFRGITAKDKQISDKETVFTFEFRGDKYALRTRTLEGGKIIKLNNASLFFFRPRNADIFYSTHAFILQDDHIIWTKEGWKTEQNECKFNISRLEFTGPGPACPQRLNGFDTFWYTWSLVNPETIILN